MSTLRDETMPDGAWEFDADVADVFDDMLERSIPQLDVMREAVSRIAADRLRDGDVLLDLGCSRGGAIAGVLDALTDRPEAPLVRPIGVEVSAPMRAAAEERFAGLDVVRILDHDLRQGLPGKKAGLEWEPMTVPGVNVVPAEDAQRFLRSLVARQGWDLPEQGTVIDPLTVALPDGWEALPGGRLLIPATDRQGIVRNDTFGSLGNASDQFALIYHETMGEIIEALVGEGAKFETSGSCREGRQVWALAYLDEPFTIAGDDTEHIPFLALLNNHDGSGACKVTMTQVRVVCWNTFQMASAEGRASGREFSFRHVGDVMGRVEDAKLALAGLRTQVDEYVEFAEELAAIKIDDERVLAFSEQFLPSPRDAGKVCSDRVQENVERARAMFRAIYNDSVTVEAIKGNGFGLLNAATEYLDHVRDYRSTDTYLGRSVLRAEPAKAKAVSLIRSFG